MIAHILRTRVASLEVEVGHNLDCDKDFGGVSKVVSDGKPTTRITKASIKIIFNSNRNNYNKSLSLSYIT